MPEHKEDGSKDSQSQQWRWLGRLKDIVAIAGSVGAAGGIMVSAYTYVVTQWAKNEEAKRAQLSTFSTYGQYLRKYQDFIQPALGRLMKNPARLELDKSMRSGDMVYCRNLIGNTVTKTGFEIFTSKSLDDARNVHNYYESIGYGLAQGQLDFEVIFDLITIPAYWNIQDPSSSWYDPRKDNFKSGITSQTFLYPDFSVMLPWRSCLGSGFFGQNKPLSDFSDSLDRLGYNYLFARMRYLYRRSCKNGKSLQYNAFTDPVNGEKWTESTLDSACIRLKSRIRSMSSKQNASRSWMKLYPGNNNDLDPLLEFTWLGRTVRVPSKI